MAITKLQPFNLDATANYTFANITASNANLGNAATASYFIGSGNNLSNIQGANVTGEVSLATYATTANAVAGANVSGQVANALLSGTVYTNAQPNITSVGTLTTLTVSGSGSFGANVNMNSFNITNLATPNLSTDAATKQYVDDVAQGLNIHDAVAAATPDTLANITTGTVTYDNGASGVGANLTTTGTFNLIDGVNVQTSGTRILVKNEANAVYNGIYTWSNATVITRASDYNSVPEVEAGDFVFVTGGTIYDNTGWVQTSTVSAIGTVGNNIEFTQFSGAGTYQAGTGLTLTGTTFSVNASQTQVTSVGTLTGLTSNGIVNFANTSNVTLGTVANLHISGGSSGYVLQTDGSGTLSWIAQSGGGSSANISNGNSNVNIPTSNGNVNITATGNTTLVITDIGVNVAGYSNVTGNVNATYFVGNGAFLTGVDTSPSDISNGSSNVRTFLNGNVSTSAAGNADILIVTGAGINVAGTTTIGTGTGGNITGANLVSANFFTGTLVNGNSNVRIATANGNVTIAAVGNTTMTITGTGANITGTANITGNVSAPFFIGNGAFLTGVDTSPANISNGTSNVQVISSGGNINTSVGGVANVLVVTTTGANIAGTLNATGTGTFGNLTVTGNGTFGNILGPHANGNSNVRIATANGNVTIAAVGNTTMTITGTGANISGYANITGNVNATYFIGNGAFLTGVDTSPSNISNGTSNVQILNNGNVLTSVNGNANVMVVTGAGANVLGYVNASGNVSGGNVNANGGQLTSTIATGTAPIVVLSTTQVPNLNVEKAGTVTTNAQPNITSTGSLTGLTVSNATGIVDFTTTANVTLGAVGNLHITGGIANYVLKTDGTGNLAWVAQSGGGGGGGSNITNGTSNVDIPAANGNITMTSAGNTIVTVTGTGANIAGYANITGNVALSGSNVSLGAVGNLKITGGANTFILSTDGLGNLSWIAQSGGGGNASAAIQEFSATTGQTTFVVAGGYQVGSVIVFVNGIQMNNADYTATDSIDVVLAEPRISGDVVRILSSMASPAVNINLLQNFSVAMSIALGI